MKTVGLPVSDKERIVLLDVLRGLAIFGILMVNMQIFFRPMLHMLSGYQADETILNLASTAFIKFFFEGKFYVMFSLLFGYGFFLFMNKPTEEGRSILPVYLRRVFFLLIFGILHVVLLWPGDILVFYALFGFLLPLFRKVSDRGLVKWAIWLVIIPTALTALAVLAITLAMNIPEASSQIESSLGEGQHAMKEMVEKAAAAYSTGTFAEVTRIRLFEYKMLLPGLLFFYPVVMAMFLLGYLAARKNLIAGYQEHLPFFRKSLRWGAFIGIPFSALFAISYFYAKPQQMDVFQALSTLSIAVGGFFLSLFYISSVVLLFSKGKLSTIAKLLSPVGRMALTNYLMQSIICTTLFYSYGFGLFGKINTFQGILLAIIIFALQIPLSRWWLKSFHYGPFEWLWRSLTYMKVQPFRKPA
ncbi:MAG: DUF418 domain-containing protein [Bacteroidales bacterium]|nr:DUF418 domain-containing protein [Bacteroidales bacterium]